MAASNMIVMLKKKIRICTLSTSRLVQTRNYSLLKYFEIKQTETVFPNVPKNSSNLTGNTSFGASF